MTEQEEKNKGKNKGNNTAQLKKRGHDLPVLFDDLVWHLAGYDVTHNPLLIKELSELSPLIEFHEKLERIRKMERFIALLIRHRENLFEYIQNEELPIKVGTPLLDQIFMQFNYVLDQGNPRQFLPEDVQFGVDLERMLDCMEKRFGKKELRPMSELMKRAVTSDNRRSRRLDRKRSEDANPNQKRKEEKLSDSDTPKNKPLPVAWSELRPSAKKDLHDFSVRLRDSLKHDDHLDLLRMVNSNAKARHKRACEYIDSLFVAHDKLTFVAVNLGFADETSISECGVQLEAFKNKVRHFSPLKGLVGFIGKWEFTPIKGLYVRIVCIFKKQEKHIEDDLPSWIGEYWLGQVTQGAGNFHVADLSSSPALFKRSTCTISASNERNLKLLKDRVIFYLTHSQEYYRYKFNASFEEDIEPERKNYEREFKKYKQDLKKYEMERKKESENGVEGDAEKASKKKPRKPQEIGRRYKALPNDSDDASDSIEPREIFFKGELVKPKTDEKPKVEKKQKVKKPISKPDQEVVTIENKTDLDVREEVVTAVTEYSAEPSVE